jgi:uncharacterized membrane protein HdeD (DUF308 family)
MANDTGADALKRYYFLRAFVSAAWVVAAFTIGAANPLIGGVLLVLYPAWDALANARDAASNGGFRANIPQAFNTVVSALVAVGVLGALRTDPGLVLVLFGAWAVLAGVLQLAAGVRRWRTYGAQWAMILSGAQSALAGGFFVSKAAAPVVVPLVTIIAPYAAFGAFYFLVSAIVLTMKGRRATRTT